MKPDSVLTQAGVEVQRHESASLLLAERTGVTLARLQRLVPLDADAELFADCGVPLPTRVDRCAGQDPTSLCLAPGDWLVFSEFLDFDRLAGQLAPALDREHTGLNDVSAALAVFRLAGDAAPWLLQKLCGLDVIGGMASGQHCARTLLDHAPVILHYHQPRIGAGPYVFDVLLDRCLARYLWQRLMVAAPHAEELHSSYGTPA